MNARLACGLALSAAATGCSLFTGLEDLRQVDTVVVVADDAGPSHFLAETFDDGDAGPLDLGSLLTTNGGAVGLTSDTYFSPVRSLRVAASASPGGSAGIARYSRELPAGATHVVVDARISPCFYPSNGFVSVLELTCREGDLAGGVWLHFFPTKGGLRIVSDMAAAAAAAPGDMHENDVDFRDPVVMPGEMWSHVHIDVHYGAQGSITLGIDGNTLPVANVPVGCATSATNTLVVGVYAEGQGASCAANYDDLVVDVE